MNLLKKLTLTKKEQKKENYFNFYLNSQISNLKNLIKDLSSLRRRDQKALRENKVYEILKELNNISYLYNGFLKDLSKFELMKKNNSSRFISPDCEEKIVLMNEKKKSLRQDFESVYISFKRTAMGLEDVPMKEILNRMREVFDFDGTSYTENKIYDNNKPEQTYYKSTNMQTRYIFEQ